MTVACDPVLVTEGTSPVVLAFPHSGTFLPDDVREALNETGLSLKDTDWHVKRLYDGLLPHATTVEAVFHRYVIDANRAPSAESLYPGQATTGLIPETDFDGLPIWTNAEFASECRSRHMAYHDAYHRALASQLNRVRAQHGFAILYDCHSIRSRVPRLFEGTLPDFNIGTFDGKSCDPSLTREVEERCRDAPGFSTVVNGRFKGGWTTRHYGNPQSGFHAVQMELAQTAYLETETAPWAYDDEKAEKLRAVLRRILCALEAWRPA